MRRRECWAPSACLRCHSSRRSRRVSPLSCPRSRLVFACPVVVWSSWRSPPFVLPRCVLAVLAGDGGGCSCSPSPSPSFVSPGCALPFAVGGGCSPCSCRLVGCSCLLLAGDGSGCSCSPSPSFTLPRCALPLVVGARTRSCCLVGCSCPPLVGMVLGTHPRLRPLLCAHPCSCGLVAWHRCCVSSWLCLLVGSC